jgi:pyrimidine-nucleoside phosphorylase
MVNIGTQAGEKVTALVSDMNQPLGNAVGNALEVKEAIETLRGGGPPDLVQHCIEIAGHMLRLAGRSTARDLSDIRPVIEEKLANGEALQMFRKLVRAQGGDVSQVDNPDKLPCAPVVEEVRAPQSGYIRGINAREVGIAVLHLGAGRLVKGEAIDHAVGAVVHHKVGERVEKDEPLFTVHARTREAAAAARDRILAAHGWSERPGMPLFYDVIFGSD